MERRKETTPAHWAYGFLCVFLTVEFGILFGLAMMAVFGIWERWNDICDGSHGGAFDWWEAFLTYCIGLIPTGILQQLGVVTIGWW